MNDRTTPIFVAMDEVLRHRAAVIFDAEAAGIKPGTVGLPPLTLEELDALLLSLARAAVLYRDYDGPVPTGPRLNTWRHFLARCASLSRWAWLQHGLACAREGVPIAGRARSVQDGFEYVWELFATWPDYNPRTVDEPEIVARLARGIGQEVLVITTEKSQEDLQRIFRELVEAGYIDGNAPEALADFLNAFDPAAEKQGRIAWIWADKRQGQPSPRHILDFVAQMAGGLDGIAPDMCDRIAPAIFGQAIARHVLSKFRTRWYRWIDSETPARICDTHADIAAIVTGV